MAINETSNMKLQKPTYLHDGEGAVLAVNDTFDLIDALVDNVVVHDGEVLTYDGRLVITYW